MGPGWRRAFCNTNRKGEAEKQSPCTPRLRCKTAPNQNSSDFVTPKCERKSPRIGVVSNPSSPRSPFSILKSTLRLSRSSCGVCSQTVKAGQKTAIYTAECSHTFHFPCIASHVRKQGALICPLCSTTWKNVPLLALYTQKQQLEQEEKSQISNTPTKCTPISSPRFTNRPDLTSYADDEQLVTPKFARNRDDVKQEEEVEEFRGFFVNPISSDDTFSFNNKDYTDVSLSILPDAAVISQGRTHHTYAVVLKVKAPPPPHVPDALTRAPIDLVTVLDVSGSMSGAKLEMLKRAMRLVIASLGSADRLSILAFAAAPKRLTPLTRMTAQGQRSARAFVDRLGCSHGSSMAEALKEATRVLEERRERNPVASIILLSDGQNDDVPENNERNRSAHSTRYAHVEIPVHSTGFSREPAENAFSKCVAGLLSVVVQDLRIQIGLAPGSDPAEITAVYSCTSTPVYLGSGCILLGDLYAEEEKELLIEIQVPISGRVGSYYVISGNCIRKDPATQELIYGNTQALLVPRPQTGRSGSARVDRLRNVFISSRAVAESRRLMDYNEVASAVQLLSSARALLLQSEPGGGAADCVRSLEAELCEVRWRREYQLQRSTVDREMGLFVDENGEPITPTSAQNLGHVKRSYSYGRVGDLHGFENARF